MQQCGHGRTATRNPQEKTASSRLVSRPAPPLTLQLQPARQGPPRAQPQRRPVRNFLSDSVPPAKIERIQPPVLSGFGFGRKP